MANCDSKPDLAQINQFLMKIGELKHLDRAGWVLRNIEKPECVAGHQYRMAIMATVLFDPEQEKDLDLNKVVKLALIHDMSECITGDITPYDQISQEDKHQQELEAMRTLSKLLPESAGKRLVTMFEEYEDRQTNESKLTKQLDVFDAVLQAYEYEKNDAKQRDGRLQVDMNHFFDPDYLAKIQHPTLRALLDQILNERSMFLSQINNNVVEFDCNKTNHAN